MHARRTPELVLWILDFREVGWNPSPEAVLTVAVEAAAIVVLTLALVQMRLATSSPRS